MFEYFSVLSLLLVCTLATPIGVCQVNSLWKVFEFTFVYRMDVPLGIPASIMVLVDTGL